MRHNLRAGLLFKLMGAFLLVIVIGALVIYFSTTQATQNAFRLYTTQSSQVLAEYLAPAYAEYYAATGSWTGVDSLVETGQAPAGMTEMMSRESGGFGARGRGMGNYGWMGGMQQRTILADGQGLVIVDTGDELTGSLLSAEELASGAAILVDDRQVGTLILAPANIQAVSDPASKFLESVNRSILVSVLIAGGISLILVLLFALQITAPVRQMQKAAGAIAQGDLSQRVPVRSRDELGDLAQAFNHMAGSLSAAEDQRRQMVADIAHELRTPMAVIQANAEAMQDGVLPVDLEQVNTIHAETLLLGRLIEDLRLISLSEAGQLRLERVETDLAGLLQQAAERVRPQCLQKGVALEVSAAGEIPPVDVDSDRIGQVINNLLSNALRYTPAGGTIAVRVERAGSAAQVSVTDSGSGISEDDLPHIFDRFYRVDKSRTRASGGSGLGLAIVRHLVEVHGGSVSAASPVFSDATRGNYGTRITFTLPIA